MARLWMPRSLLLLSLALGSEAERISSSRLEGLSTERGGSMESVSTEEGGVEAHVAGPTGEEELDLGAETKCGGSEEAGLLQTDSGANASSRGGSSFYNYQCTENEWKEFKSTFGLKGEGCFSSQSFSNKPKCPQNNVVWFYPTHDHNGAFCINRNVCYRLLSWSRLACSVQVYRVNSAAEVIQQLHGYGTRSVRHLVLGGHGTGQALGFGDGDGFMGVTMNVAKIPVGSTVSFKIRVPLLVGGAVPENTPGFVGQVDDSYVLVYFRGMKPQWISASYFIPELISTSKSWTTELMEEISLVVQYHSSLFLDSCLSATPKVKPNLAQYVTEEVRKGVRVIGSAVSFMKVEVQRFSGWHTELHTQKMRNAQRIFVTDARCPSFASSHSLNKAENCECGAQKVCKTRSGKECPSARGLLSSSEFLPVCGEQWFDDPCSCEARETRLPEPLRPEPLRPLRPEPLRPVLSSQCPTWAESPLADKVGNCKCPGNMICYRRGGQRCPMLAGYKSRSDFMPPCEDCECREQNPVIRTVTRPSSETTQNLHRCPSWSRSPEPDANGNCACKESFTCRTEQGLLCPRRPGPSGEGQWSYFFPSCHTSVFTTDRCRCIQE